MAKNPQIILIDGPAGSGKTTLAKKLEEEIKCEVVHLDYLYNGWDDALGESLTSVLIDLVTDFSSKKDHLLNIYDWAENQFNSTRLIKAAPTLIIEGVGAGQSATREFATTLYWVEADPQIGLARVLERDGIEIEAQMRRWQKREASHFAAERTREYADLIISTT